MVYLPGLLALALAALSITHADEPDGLIWMGAYGVGALLALSACKPEMTRWPLRILAVASTVTMFLYLAGFFLRAPHLSEGWYAEGNSGTLALLVAGFCMMPVVSAFTCRLKTQASGST